MVLVFADGTEGLVGITDWQFWELTEFAKSGHVNVSLTVQVREGVGWRIRHVNIRELLTAERTYHEGRMKIFQKLAEAPS
jgi:hypothetical protein